MHKILVDQNMGKTLRTRPAAEPNRARTTLKPTDDLDWDAVEKELREYFTSNEDADDAKTALADLVAAGCDESTILRNLYLFCGGDPRAMQALRDDLAFDRCKQRMLAIAQLAHRTSSEIGAAEQMLADLGLSHTMKPDVVSLERYADLLRRVGEVAYRLMASKRISGRDQHLVYLSRMIGDMTGKRYHRELADLVNATRRFYDPEAPAFDTEDIRKRVSRYGALDLVSEIELDEEKAKRFSRLKHK